MPRNNVNYEWVFEYTDEHGDIHDHERGENLKDLNGDWHEEYEPVLVLVRDEGNDVEGLLDRCWCYPKGIEMSEYFSDEWGREIRQKVPQKYLKEFHKYKARFGLHLKSV